MVKLFVHFEFTAKLLNSTQPKCVLKEGNVGINKIKIKINFSNNVEGVNSNFSYSIISTK